MSREKQIEELEEIIKQAMFQEWKKGNATILETRDAYGIAEALYNAGYRKQSEWISVDEMLPEEYGGVICYSRNGSLFSLTYNPKYKLFNVSFDNVEDAIAVDYWMPLPEAPKGGEE